MASTSAQPIRVLRQHVTALEAAITLCLAEPQAKSVHRLRTTTRRIEGQLALLAVLPGVPAHDKGARKARRFLKKLRRAAGDVRDTDVQLDLIEEIAATKRAQAFRKDSDRLREALTKDREKFSQKLLKTLRRHQADTAGALEDLLKLLEPAETLALPATRLSLLAREWFTESTPAEPKAGAEDPDYLHAIRKVAKLTRYIAENAPKQAKMPRRLAESFEKLQQSGGEWHDWLVLAGIAEDKLGSSSPVTQAFMHRSRVSLAAYRRHLREMAK